MRASTLSSVLLISATAIFAAPLVPPVGLEPIRSPCNIDGSIADSGINRCNIAEPVVQHIKRQDWSPDAPSNHRWWDAPPSDGPVKRQDETGDPSDPHWSDDVGQDGSGEGMRIKRQDETDHPRWKTIALPPAGSKRQEDTPDAPSNHRWWDDDSSDGSGEGAMKIKRQDDPDRPRWKDIPITPPGSKRQDGSVDLFDNLSGTVVNDVSEGQLGQRRT